MCNACIAHYINLSLKVLVIATCQNGFLYKRKTLSLCLIMCGCMEAGLSIKIDNARNINRVALS